MQSVPLESGELLQVLQDYPKASDHLNEKMLHSLPIGATTQSLRANHYN